MNRIVIVGASAGGLVTAEALRRAGYRGVLTLVRDEPQLPYDRPPLSKQFLKGEWEPDRLALCNRGRTQGSMRVLSGDSGSCRHQLTGLALTRRRMVIDLLVLAGRPTPRFTKSVGEPHRVYRRRTNW
jgi:hypothetical protein